MGSLSMYYVDRTGWGTGPWDGEPDYVLWESENGLNCLVVRNAMGALCGYVGVPPTHKLHGKNWHEIECFDVHGGLTYSGKRVEEDDDWWFGFDCAHAYDLVPGLVREKSAKYRDIVYVRAEVSNLARQLGGG